MPGTSCGICGKSHDDYLDELRCAVGAAEAILAGMFGANVIITGREQPYSFESVVLQYEPDGPWQGICQIRYTSGRLTTYKSPEMYEKQEDAIAKTNELYEQFVTYCKENGAELEATPEWN